MLEFCCHMMVKVYNCKDNSINLYPWHSKLVSWISKLGSQKHVHVGLNFLFDSYHNQYKKPTWKQANQIKDTNISPLTTGSLFCEVTCLKTALDLWLHVLLRCFKLHVLLLTMYGQPSLWTYPKIPWEKNTSFYSSNYYVVYIFCMLVLIIISPTYKEINKAASPQEYHKRDWVLQQTKKRKHTWVGCFINFRGLSILIVHSLTVES